MTAKVVSIRALRDSADDTELHASAAALNASLGQKAEACPKLVAIGWCVNGTPGSVCGIRATDSKQMVILPSTRDQMKELARVIRDFPEPLRTAFELQMDLIRIRRQQQAARMPQDAPAEKR